MSTYPELTRQVTLARLAQKKRKGEKITVLTAYDYPIALLVDGVGRGRHPGRRLAGHGGTGLDTTVPVTMEIMLHHTPAVRRGTQRALLVADMPFLSYQVNADEAVRNAGRLLQEGEANAVKLEGGVAIAPTLRRIVEAGIPVMAHIGFTPQSVHLLGVRKQGKDEAGAQAGAGRCPGRAGGRGVRGRAGTHPRRPGRADHGRADHPDHRHRGRGRAATGRCW